MDSGMLEKSAAPRYAKTGRQRMAHVDAVQKIPTKCGAVADFPVAAPGRRPIFSGVIFSWDFFLAARAAPVPPRQPGAC
jgi:hypothetical protein